MKRLPKGFGSVYKLSGSRRKPYRACKLVDGKYITLGYYATSADAVEALTAYNKNPYDLSGKTATIADMWEIFKERRFGEISASGVQIYKAAYKHIQPIWDSPVKNLKTYTMQKLVDGIDRGWQTKSHVQSLLHQIFEMAIELDVVDKNYAAFIKLGNKPKSVIHKAFTAEEIQRLFESVFAEELADTVLIMIYTGMRPSELLSVKTEDIHLSEKYIVGGSKTEAGRNRVIPLSDKIMPLVLRRYDESNKFFIDLSYRQYKKKFDELMERLGMDHLPHDCRHTFASMANTAGMNPTVVKLIMGHASKDLTERVYTHKAVDELVVSVNMI